MTIIRCGKLVLPGRRRDWRRDARLITFHVLGRCAACAVARRRRASLSPSSLLDDVFLSL
jgi:hypothetical protein